MGDFTYEPWRELNTKANFQVTINFVFDGLRGREIYYVHDERKLRWNESTNDFTDPCPEAIAWREFEHEALFDLDLPSEECTCCLARWLDFSADFVIEKLT